MGKLLQMGVEFGKMGRAECEIKKAKNTAENIRT